MGLTYSSVVDASLGEVSAWHARPGAETRLAPPWPSAAMLAGALGSPLLSAVLPWRHTREFSAVGPRGTLVTDVVDTPLPARVLRPAYAYRHRQLAADLAALDRARAIIPETLTIAVTGSGGLVGTALTALLSAGGHRVVRLVRRLPRHAGERHWRPDDPDPALLDGVDVVIHLAGASIGGRFTPGRKAEIRDSRILPTRRLAELAASAASAASASVGGTGGTGESGGTGGTGPRVFVTASAIGIYGPDRGDEVLTEDSPRGDGFLADVVAGWEAAAAPAAAAGLRTVSVRTGLVQTPRGGMLRLLGPLFEAGLGGRLGTGKQWLAWIGLDDLLDVYLRAATDPGLSGPVNAVAPDPVRDADYTRTLAAVLRRPAVLPVPGFGSRLLLGEEGAREIAQASQCVTPDRLLRARHSFRQPDLEGALRHMFGRDQAGCPPVRTAGAASDEPWSGGARSPGREGG